MARPGGRPVQALSNRYYLNHWAWDRAGEHFCGRVLNCGYLSEKLFLLWGNSFSWHHISDCPATSERPGQLPAGCDHRKTGDTGKEHNIGDFSNLTRSVSHTVPDTFVPSYPTSNHLPFPAHGTPDVLTTTLLTVYSHHVQTHSPKPFIFCDPED